MEGNSKVFKVYHLRPAHWWDNSLYLGLVTAVIAVVIALIVFSLYRKSQSKKTGILFVGLSESGKTLIFARLLHGKFVQTHTSVKENVGDYPAGNETLKIIDIPGHERLRGRIFDNYKAIARGLIFIIDSGNIQQDIKDVAEYLYDILSDSTVRKNLPPLLILCNKQDNPVAKSCNVVKALLEKEINILRTTKTSQLMSTENTVDQVYLGKEGKDFEFNHLLPMRIDFGESCAVIKPDDSPVDVKVVNDWINAIL